MSRLATKVSTVNIQLESSSWYICHAGTMKYNLHIYWVRTLNRITIQSLGYRSDRPVIGGDLVDGLVSAGWWRLMLMYSQSTPGSTQPGERPVTSRCGDVSSTGNTPSCGMWPLKKKKCVYVTCYLCAVKRTLKTPGVGSEYLQQQHKYIKFTSRKNFNNLTTHISSENVAMRPNINKHTQQYMPV